MDVPTKQRIFAASLSGNRCTLTDYVLTLVDREKRMENGSATVFRIGGHVLVATAAHLIPNNPSGRIWPLVRDVRYERDGFPQYVSFARHPDYDVGYLAIHPEGVAKYFGQRNFCTLSQVALRGPGRENKGVILVGSPSEHVRVTPYDRTTMTYKANIMMYWTVPLLPQEWPSLPANAKPGDKDVDIFLDYPEDDAITSELRPTKLPHPGGTSGGGIWDQEFNEGQLWDPTKIKLIGIQSRWDQAARYLRGTQIVHWLRLVFRDFADLRELLRKEFGDAVAFIGSNST